MENTETTADIKSLSENKIQIFLKLYKSLKRGTHSACSQVPQKWLAENKLSMKLTRVGFSSGQLHHGKEQKFKDELESVGFLVKTEIPSSHGGITYKCFGKGSMLFPLRNKDNEIINFCSISIKNGKTEYMNEYGIYPEYPKKTAQKLFLAQTVLETATILESETLKENEAVMSLFDGQIKQQHIDAIKSITELKEIIIVGNITIKNNLL
ncbi:MAG: hypothetical protein WC223_10730 [Bacteroidales bacterium]